MIRFIGQYLLNISTILELKLAQWSPLKADELEQHKLDSQNYMRNAINNNRQTEGILESVMQISDKIQLTKEILLNFSNGNALGKNNISCFIPV